MISTKSNLKLEHLKKNFLAIILKSYDMTWWQQSWDRDLEIKFNARKILYFYGFVTEYGVESVDWTLNRDRSLTDQGVRFELKFFSAAITLRVTQANDHPTTFRIWIFRNGNDQCALWRREEESWNPSNHTLFLQGWGRGRGGGF